MTEGLRFDENRTTVVLNALTGPLHGFSHRQHIIAVDFDRRNRQAQSARRQTRLAGRFGDAGGDGKMVVLDKEHHRQVEDCGEVEGFIRDPVLHPTVTEEGHRDSVFTAHLVGQGITGGVGHLAGDDGARSHDAGVDTAQMHRAATTTTKTRCESQDLGHGAQHRFLHLSADRLLARIVALGCRVVENLGQALMVHAMRAVDAVMAVERRHGADRATLLTDTRMDRAVHQPLTLELEELFLEPADHQKLFQHAGEFVRLLLSPIGIGHLQAGPERVGLERDEFGHYLGPSSTLCLCIIRHGEAQESHGKAWAWEIERQRQMPSDTNSPKSIALSPSAMTTTCSRRSSGSCR